MNKSNPRNSSIVFCIGLLVFFGFLFFVFASTDGPFADAMAFVFYGPIVLGGLGAVAWIGLKSKSKKLPKPEKKK